jgi:hypothetical protein
MDDETLTIFKMKRSASGQLNKAFSTAIKQQFITVDDAYEMVGLFFLNPDVIQSWTQLLHLKYENYEQIGPHIKTTVGRVIPYPSIGGHVLGYAVPKYFD